MTGPPLRAELEPRRAGGGLLPVLMVVLAFLAVVAVYPVSRLVLAAFREGEAWTTRFLTDVLTARGLAGAAWNSLWVACSVTVVATLLGSVLAWLVARTDVPGRRHLRWALLTPFVIPPFVAAIAWLQLLGGAGWLNLLARQLPLVEGGVWNVRGADGIVFVLVLTTYPLAYVTVLGSLDRLDPALEEGARIAGARLGRTLRDVTIPVMWPAVTSGAALVFIASMANFGVPAVLGFTEGFFVMTTRIFDLIARSARPGSLNQAAALSLVLGLSALISLYVQRRGTSRADLRLPQRSSPQTLLTLGTARVAVGILGWAVVLVAGVLPLVAITLGALTDVPGRLPLPGNLTWEAFRRVLVANPAGLRAVRNSLTLALSAGTVIAVVGAAIGYLVRRTRLPARELIDGVATFPYALPGTVVAVAVLLAFIRPVAGVSLFNTLWIILVAYLANYLAYGVRAASGALAMIDPALEEASRVSGASRRATFRRIVLPLIRPAMFGGFFLVFIPTLRELTISALLWSPGNETIGVLVFNLQAAGETQAAAAMAVLLVLTVGVMNVLTRRISGGRVGY